MKACLPTKPMFCSREYQHTLIEVEIDVTDKSPIFIRPYHMREEDKSFIDKQMRKLCYLGILKEGFLVYSSPVMLISRKVMNDK